MAKTSANFCQSRTEARVEKIGRSFGRFMTVPSRVKQYSTRNVESRNLLSYSSQTTCTMKLLSSSALLRVFWPNVSKSRKSLSELTFEYEFLITSTAQRSPANKRSATNLITQCNIAGEGHCYLIRNC